MSAPRAPIFYAAACRTVRSAISALKVAGVIGCKIAPSAFGRLIEGLEQVAELLGMHAERQAAKAGDGR